MKILAQLLGEYSRECADALRVHRREYSIAGCSIQLSFAGERWADLLTKAIAHLPVPGTSGSPKPRLNIHLWDGSRPARSRILQTYLSAVTQRWFEYVGPRGELLDVDGPPVLAFYHPGPDLLSVIDLDAGEAFYWKRDLSPLPYYEAGSPLRTLLHAWMRTQGIQFVHAAAVGTASGGVLLAGKGGSGKSTCALACLNSKLKYAGDDYCMVGWNGPGGQPWLHSLYNTAKLTGDADLARFPQFAPWVWNRERQADEKATFFLHEHLPGRLIRGFPLRAIVVPIVTGGVSTRLEPCSAREVLLALGPSTLAQLPASGPEDLACVGTLVRSLPSYKLLVGTDLSQIPAAIEGLLNPSIAARLASSLPLVEALS